MKSLTFFIAVILVKSASTAITYKSDGRLKIEITEETLSELSSVYTAEHDIVNIMIPLTLNFLKDFDNKEKSDSGIIMFIVEADINEKGERVDQGLYLLKDGHASKLLDNGRDAAATIDYTNTTYFAANDGIYSYNAQKIKAEKYGSITDSLISIAKVNGNDVLYVLTDDHILYKVTEKGNKKEKIDTVVNAKQIVLDYQNVLYYYTTDNEVYALGSDGVKKIEGLPKNPTYVNILRPPYELRAGVPVVVNSRSYIIYKNGTTGSGSIELEFTVKPTADSIETNFIHYYAYNKKIYEYCVFCIVIGGLSEARTSLNIQSVATRSIIDAATVNK